MPTILTHAALPVIVGWAAGGHRIPKRLVVAGAIAAVLPDLDVVAFRLGIPYGAPLGHRGISHSLAVALLFGMLAASAAPSLRSRRWLAFLFVALAAASHGLTDMLTNGGRGVAFWWPLSDDRFFAPLRPIDVSAIGVRGLQNGSILGTVASELMWLVVPAFVLALLYRR